MAVLNFSITVPDSQLPRVISALRYAFNVPTATTAELTELVRQDALAKIKSIVRTYEEMQAQKAATPPATIDAT